MIATGLGRISAAAARHSLVTGTLLLAVTLGALMALPSFRIESDIASLFPEGHPALELRQLTEASAGSARSLLVVLHGRPSDDEILDLAASLEELAEVESVTATRDELLGGAGAEARSAPLYFLTAEDLDHLAERLTGAERREALEALRDRLASDPFAGARLVRSDPLEIRWIFEAALRRLLPPGLDPGSPCLVLRSPPRVFLLVRGREEPFDVAFSQRILAEFEQRLEPMGEYELVGGYVAARADERRLRNDLTVSAFCSILLVTAYLAIATRRWREPLRIVAPCALAIVWTLGYGGLVLGPLSPLATASAAVLAGLGVDFAIHWVSRFRLERRQHDVGIAIRRTAEGVGAAISIGAASSVVAFLSFAASRFHGLWTLGILLGAGLLLAFAGTFTVLPCLMRRAEGRARPEGEDPPPRLGLVLRWLQSPSRGRAGGILAGGTLLLAGAGWAAVAGHGLRFDADPARLRPADDPATSALKRVESTLGFSPIPMALLVDAGVPLEHCRRALEELERNDVLALSLGPHRTVPSEEAVRQVEAFRERVEGWQSGARDDLRELGYDPAAFATGLESYEQWLRARPAGGAEPHGDRVSWQGREHWLFRLYPRSGGWTRADRDRLRERIGASFGEPIELVAPVGLADDLGPALGEDLERCAWLAAAGAVVILLLLLRSPAAALAAGLPTFAALGIILGSLSVTGSPLHLGNFIAIPLLVGVGLDDGVHLVTRLREARAGRASGEWETILHDTVRPIWRTTATTMLAFGSLLLSRTPGLSSLGALLTAGIALCFVTTLFTLPRLLPPPILRR